MIETVHPIVVIGSIAAVIAAVIGTVVLVRSIIRDRPQIQVKVLPKYSGRELKHLSRIIVCVTDRSNRAPSIELGPHLELSDGDTLYKGPSGWQPVESPGNNIMEFDIDADDLKAQLRNRRYIKSVWVRQGGRWFRGRVPTSINEALKD